MGRKLFCEINPTCYKISVQKERLIRFIKDFFSNNKFSKTYYKDELPNIVKSHSSVLVRKLHGVDIKLQENKITNIELACKRINGLIIKPGEVFSYWKIVGDPSKKKGYKEGLVISKKGFTTGYGGGLCQMANIKL